MPPDLNIYVLTPHRNRATINRFSDTLIDRSASEGEREIMMVRLPHDPETEEGEKWTCEPVTSLSHAIERGLASPPRAFTVYLKPRPATLSHACVAFTTDNQLVLGVSVDDSGVTDEAWADTERQAREWLDLLAQQSDAFLGLILVEEPPPLSESAFRQFGALVWLRS